MTSCYTYVEFKQELKLEKYLLCENLNHRQTICNFTLNSTRIPKVTDRYKGLERSQRFCNVYNDNSVGDEFHVLFECENPCIVNFRKKYLPNSYITHPSIWKLISPLQSDKTKVICNLGVFYHCLNKAPFLLHLFEDRIMYYVYTYVCMYCI